MEEQNSTKKSAWLIALIVIAIAVGLCIWFLKSSGDSTIVKYGEAGGPVKFAGTDWPIFHGNSGLTGVCDVELPDRPDVLWTFTTEQKLPFKGSAVIAGNLVYAGSFDNLLYALNLEDGRIIWKYELGGSIEGTPCVADGKVFVGSHDTNICAFDALKGGVPLWQVKTGDAIKGGPNYIDGKVLCGSYDNYLYCLDGKTGMELWKFQTTNYINGTPAISGGKTVFGGCDGLVHVLDIAKGEELGSVEAGAYIAGSAAFDGNDVFVGQHENEFLAVDVGANKTTWHFRSPKGEPFDSTPAVTKDVVIVGCDDRKLYCLTRAGGTIAWTFPAKSKIASSPVIARNRVVFGDDKGWVYMLNLADGKLIWSYEVGGHVDSSPAVSNNLIIVTAENGTVTAFGKRGSSSPQRHEGRKE